MMCDDENGGEWYQDGRYVRNHRRQVALAHCQDEEIAEQIVTDHNRALDGEREVERLRAALVMERDLVREIYVEGHTPGDLPLRWWRERLKHMNAALAAPTTAGGPAEPQVAGHLWSMRSRPENETLSVMKACCDLPQTAHAGVTWAELHVYADELLAAWLEADASGTSDPDSGGRGEGT